MQMSQHLHRLQIHLTFCIPMPPSGRREDSLLPKAPPSLTDPSFTNSFQAVNLPTKVGVTHCQGHQIGSDEILRGNRKANKVAKELSLSSAPAFLLITPTIQPQYSPTKKASLLQQGASFQGNWLVKNQKLILPQEQTKEILTSLH